MYDQAALEQDVELMKLNIYVEYQLVVCSDGEAFDLWNSLFFSIRA